MSWAPSEAKPTVSTVLVGGEISSPLLGTEGPSWRGAPEEARWEGILYLGTILWPATAGQWEVVKPGPGELSPGLPGAERSGEMHTDEATPTSAPSRPVRYGCMWEKQCGQWDVSRDANRSTCAWPNSLHISSTTSGWSLHSPGFSPCLDRMSCSYIVDPLGCKLLEETATTLGTTGGFGMPVCNVDVTANPPGDLCRRPPMCCLIGWAQGGPCDLLENSWEQEIQPTSLEVWCSSSPFMCHERWWSFHRLWLERPSKIIPQPAREASVHNQIVEVSVPLSGWKKPQRVLPNP